MEQAAENSSNSQPSTEVKPVKKVRPKQNGRPGKLFKPVIFTPELIQKIADNIGLGMPAHLACAEVDPPVKLASFDQQLIQHEEYREIVTRAQAKWCKRALINISSGVQGWQGDAWILERRHAGYFRRTDPTVTVNQTTINQFAIPEEILNDIGTRALQQFGRQAVAAIPAQTQEGQAEVDRASDYGLSFGK